jgi:hypothetical protein
MPEVGVIVEDHRAVVFRDGGCQQVDGSCRRMPPVI